MKAGLTTPQQREIIVTVGQTALLAGGAFFLFLLVGGMTILEILGAVVLLAILGLVNYFIWGRWSEEEMRNRPNGTPIANVKERYGTEKSSVESTRLSAN